VLETLPPVEDQVTAVLLVPLTLALKSCCAPVCKLAEVGETLTETMTGAVTETVAEADLVESATLVAVTV
jgi:hypothetical protein